MGLRNPNFSFLLLMVVVVPVVIIVCDGATLPPTAYHGATSPPAAISGTTSPTMTTAEPPPPPCSSDNFQLPLSQSDSHVILTQASPPFSPIKAVTISFTAKMKTETKTPTVIIYKVGRRIKFALELQGRSDQAGYYIGECGDAVEHNFPLNKWTQVTATWNGITGEYAIYMDGVAVVGPNQEDDCKNSRGFSGGKFILGGELGKHGMVLDSRFIGAINNVQIWPFVFTASQLKALWEGDFSHPEPQILVDPPTYGAEVKSGARCDRVCMPGQYVIQHSGSEIRCRDCPAGQFSADMSSHSCTQCSPGTYASAPSSKSCMPCPVGYFQEKSSQAICHICSPGTYSSELGSHTCTICSPGTYSASPGSNKCELCPVGHYQDKTNQANCKVCNPGEFSDEKGSHCCKNCTQGTYASSSASQSCTLCPVGYFQDKISQAVCKICPPGKYSDKRGRHSCMNCSPGTHSANRGSLSCSPCSVGYFQRELGQAECEVCPAGEYSLDEGSKRCDMCPTSLPSKRISLPSIDKPTFMQCLEGKFITIKEIVDAAVKEINLEIKERVEDIKIETKEDNEELKKVVAEIRGEMKASNKEMSKVDAEIRGEMKASKQQLSNADADILGKMNTSKEELSKVDGEIRGEMKDNKEELSRANTEMSAKIEKNKQDNDKISKALEKNFDEHVANTDERFETLGNDTKRRIDELEHFSKALEKNFNEHVANTDERFETLGNDTKRRIDLLEHFSKAQVITEDGTAWIVIQRRNNVARSDGFDTNWVDYKNGFGNYPDSYWLGLQRMHELTKTGNWQLMLKAKCTSGSYAGRWGKLVYNGFSIGDENSGYQIRFGSMLKKESAERTFDSLRNTKFTTKDKDNDNYITNCAVSYKGGWWYIACFNGLNLNSDQGYFGSHAGTSQTLMAMRRT